MEFVQFHPTGIYGLGVLISEAARGEGGILRNGEGNRFMEDYAPVIKDLAPRDVVSRAIMTEIREGRGIDGRDFVHLDLTSIGKERLAEKLSDISSFVRIYLGLDTATDPIPVKPTCHYMMGGIPTNMDGAVLDEKGDPVPGLYAAGECSCISLHGANRLGCNSLVDLVVFGRRGGQAHCSGPSKDGLAGASGPARRGRCSEIGKTQRETKRREGRSHKGVMQKLMSELCSVFRNEKGLREALSELGTLMGRYDEVAIDDRGTLFNTDIMEACELESLLGLAETILLSAIARTESRGAHFREDYPERDDVNWLKHTLVKKTDDGPRISYKPVTITRFQPKARTY